MGLVRSLAIVLDSLVIAAFALWVFQLLSEARRVRTWLGLPPGEGLPLSPNPAGKSVTGAEQVIRNDQSWHACSHNCVQGDESQRGTSAA